MNLKNLSLLVVITLLITTLTNCKKDKDPTPAPPVITAAMTATVDGNAWTALPGKISAAVDNTSSLKGTASDSTTITFTISEKIALNGTYEFSSTSGNTALFSNSPSSAVNAWSTGNTFGAIGALTITAMDSIGKRISGTFSFKAYRFSDNSFKDVTNGAFTNVSYTAPTISGGNNTFSVKIDNVTFTPSMIDGATNGSEIILMASDNQSKSVELYMPINITSGTYTIGQPGISNYYGIYSSSTGFSTSSSGSLTISSHNSTTKKITGTFNFMADTFGSPPVYNLTNGSFSITYE